MYGSVFMIRRDLHKTYSKQFHVGRSSPSSRKRPRALPEKGEEDHISLLRKKKAMKRSTSERIRGMRSSKEDF